MSIFRQYIAPVLIVLVFLVAMIAVSARAFLPGDMAAPAPIEEADALSRVSPMGLYAQFVDSLPVEDARIAQFFTGPFHVGQFHIGQFYVR